MFQEILMKIDFISPIFYQVLYMTVVGSIVGLIIYFIRNIFDSKISGKWKCLMWIVALITLLVPIRFEIQTTKTPIIQNEIINRVEDIKNIGNYENYFDESFSNINDFEQKSFSNTEELESIQSEKISTNESSSNIKEALSTKYIFLNMILPAIWLLGTISFIATFLSGIRKINKRITRNVYRDERIQNILREAKNQLHIKKKVKIILQKYKKVPSIFGIFNPSILITEQMLDEDNETIKYIFLHELSHYKRKDILFNFILLCVLSIHWFNPIVWFLFKKIRQDIEIGADELASKGLNKDEVKQYGMVLINLLRSRIEENYTASMLCMSDTGKNMERRILMIKRKSTSIILSIILLIIIAGVVAGVVFIKVENVEELPSFSDISIFPKNDNAEPITEEEKTEISEYIDEICNQFFTYTLPEFSGINNADRYWIYAHLKVKNTGYGSQDNMFTKEEIEEYLVNIFGDELQLDVEKDEPEFETILTPSETFGVPGKYSLLITGDLITVEYAIDYIKKEDGQYIVNVIEYTDSRDIMGSMDYNCAVYAYEENDNQIMKDWKRIFSSDGMNEAEVESRVLNRKNEFRAFNITLAKDENQKLRVKEIKLDTDRSEGNNVTHEIIDRRANANSYIKDRGELISSGLWSLDGVSSNSEISLIDSDMTWNNESGLYHKIITNMSDYNKYSARIRLPEMNAKDFEESFLVIVTVENLKPKDEVDLYVYDVTTTDLTTHIVMKQKENPIIHYMGIGEEPKDGKRNNYYESENNIFYAIVEKNKLKDNVDVIIEH